MFKNSGNSGNKSKKADTYGIFRGNSFGNRVVTVVTKLVLQG